MYPQKKSDILEKKRTETELDEKQKKIFLEKSIDWI